MKTIHRKLSTSTIFVLLLLSPSLAFSQTTGNGSPRFILQKMTDGTTVCGIKASCIDTRYEEFIRENPGAITYQWGIKTEGQPLTWIQTGNPELDATRFEGKEYVTVYFRITDTEGNTTSPIYIRVAGSGFYNLQFYTFIVNRQGELYSDQGELLSHQYTTMPLISRDPATAQARWSPVAGKVINDKNEEWDIPCTRNGYIRDILPATEIEQILSSPAYTATLYRLTLLNYSGEIIQEFPITLLCKPDFPEQP
ncbi:MAG: hypothetical protein LUD15_13255 [Bacteroides sp.]|nr:hypothetical protein [Bacteroides sp.]